MGSPFPSPQGLAIYQAGVAVFSSRFTEVLFPATVDGVPFAPQRYRDEVVRKNYRVVVSTIKLDLKHQIHANLHRLLTRSMVGSECVGYQGVSFPVGVSPPRRPAESSTRLQTATSLLTELSISITTYIKLNRWLAQTIRSSMACLRFDEELKAQRSQVPDGELRVCILAAQSLQLVHHDEPTGFENRW